MLVITREMVVQRLLELPGIANESQGSAPFRDQVLAWMRSVEDTLLRVRHPTAGLVSVQRSKLLAASDGFREPGIYAERLTQRKVERVAATFAMGEVAAALEAIVVDHDRRLDGLREKMVQLLAVVSASKPLPAPGGQNREEWLRVVWRVVGGNSDTRSMFNYISAAADINDVSVLLDDVLTNLLGEISSEGAQAVVEP